MAATIKTEVNPHPKSPPNDQLKMLPIAPANAPITPATAPTIAPKMPITIPKTPPAIPINIGRAKKITSKMIRVDRAFEVIDERMLVIVFSRI
jgi:hypothetical protein